MADNDQIPAAQPAPVQPYQQSIMDPSFAPRIPIDASPEPTSALIPVDLGTPSSPPVPDAVATRRASMASFGLSDIGKSFEDVYRAISGGNEDSLRSEIATQLTAQKSLAAQSKIMDIAGGATAQGLTTDQVNQITDNVQQANQPIDPKSVIEGSFAGKFVGTLAKDLPKYDLDAHQAGLFGKDYATKDQALVTAIQNAQAKADAQSTLGYIGDQALNLVFMGLREDWLARGNIPGVSFLSGFAGSNVDAQRKSLWMMPINEFNQVGPAAIDKIAEHDPNAAVAFGNAMRGNFDKNFDDLASAANLIPIGGSIGKMIIKGGLRAIGKEFAVTAVKDTVKGIESTLPVKVAVHQATGNLPEAAIQQTTAETVARITGQDNPAKSAVEGLPNIMQEATIAKSINAGNGPGVQEISNRIREALDSSDNNILDAIGGISRINRIPAALATEDSMRIVYDHVKDLYKGPNSTVVKIDKIVEPLTNTVHLKLQIARPDGSLFETPDSGRMAAIMDNHTLMGEVQAGRQLELQKAIEKANYNLEHQRAALKLAQDHGTPPVAKGSVRFFHGASGGDPASGRGRWTSPRYDYARNYRTGGYIDTETGKHYPGTPNDVYYVDLPKGHPDEVAARAWDEILDKGTNAVGQYMNHEMPESVAKQMKLHTGRMGEDLSDEQKAGMKALGLDYNNLNHAALVKSIIKSEDDIANATKELTDLRKLPGATIEQQGAKFYIQRTVPLDETSPVIRKLLLTTKESQARVTGDVKAILGFLRSGDETTSLDNMANAKQTLSSSNVLLSVVKSELAPIRKLKGLGIPFTEKANRWSDFESVINSMRTDRDLIKNDADISKYYLTNFGRMPLPQETAAVHSYRRLGELQNMVTSLDLYTEESRQGIEMHNINILDKNGNPTSSGMFKGKQIKELPKDGHVLIFGKQLGEEKFTQGTKFRKQVMEDVASGKLKVFKVTHPDASPFKNFGDVAKDNLVRYVIAENTETTPLQVAKSNTLGGGLWDLKYPHYIKQARMKFDEASKTWRYKGDTTVMPMANGALGRRVVQQIENVRQLIAAGKPAEAEIEANKTAMGWNNMKDWFTPRNLPDGTTVPSKLDLNEPIRLVPGNKMVVNMDNELSNRAKWGGRFRDDTKNKAIFQNLIKTEHDNYELYTVKDKGTRNNPLYSYEPAEYLDPITSLNRGVKRLSDSVYMDDYKTFAVEHWIQAAKGKIGDATGKAISDKQLASAPFHYFYNGKFQPGTTLADKARLEDMRMKAQQIWGTPSLVDTTLHQVAQTMHDSIYNKFGGAVASRLDPTWMLETAGNAASKLRAATFHATIGLFALPQFIVQNMNYATIFGLEGPVRAGAGTMAGFFHALASRNESFVPLLDAMASKMGFRPGEFTEARKLMYATGANLVGSDHSLAVEGLNSNFIRGGINRFLDLGSLPFQMGEKNQKFAAWYTAYKKFRDVNPTGALDDKAVREIFNRATMLAGQMSTASKSMLQRGPMAFTSQFLGYNLRLVEMMTGKQLTKTEKLRLAGTYWGLFGVSAAGLAGYPFDESIRQGALKNGYADKVDDWHSWAMNGIPASLIQWATGNLPGVGQRYGNPGLEFTKDAIDGKNYWKLVSGASGAFAYNTWTQTSGLRTALMSMYQNDDDKHFPIRSEDLVDPLRMVSSMHMTTRLISTLSTGNWLDKRGHEVESDVSPTRAILQSLTGVQSQKAYDIHNYSEIQEAQKQDEAQTEQEFLNNINRFSQAVKIQDWEQAKEFGIRAKALLISRGYPEQKKAALYARAEDGQSQYDRSIYNFYLGRDVSGTDRDTRTDAYKTIQQGKQ